MEPAKTYNEELAAQLEGWNAQVDLYKEYGANDVTRTEFIEISEALQRMQDEARMKLHP